MVSFDAKRCHINEWVASSTGGKIQHLLSSGCLTENSALLIVGAIYFNGSWQSAFDKQDTEEAEFYRLDGSAISVQMMYLEEDFDYVDLPEMDARAIRLPFKEEKWAMLIVLPNRNDGLSFLISQLMCNSALNSLLSTTFLPKRITLYLPRFKMKESVSNLKLALANLGMNRVFSSTECDLSGISPDRPLFVSDICHRAVLESHLTNFSIQIDERGARATATTDLCVSDGIGDYFNECFKVDHPFFVALLSPNNTIAFMGHVTSPLYL
ncbi:unnamed protein product [Calicophoron daubneyi]|uniref:Serpin domain-containing protein n=1 Tax=Calicophoron daubneyi TaxID=300641 RepID=A0AAV2TSC2_CALDB